MSRVEREIGSNSHLSESLTLAHTLNEVLKHSTSVVNRNVIQKSCITEGDHKREKPQQLSPLNRALHRG